MTTRFDAVTLEVLWTRIISVVDEAAKAIVRTSFSTLSNEANDFACVLTDARGFALAQNTGSIPSFIGTLPATVRHFLRGLGPERMRPGDVLITNNPWMGTGHLSDVCLIKPVFHGGRLVAFSATTAHMPDIGGRIRAIEAREVFEEGLHIPLAKFLHEGRPDETLIQLLRANVRTPDQTVGDIWAQVSANNLMESRVRQLLDEYGLGDFTELGDELFGRCERAMREAIRAVPDGTYRYAMRTDGTDTPLDFHVALTVAGDEIVADYAGTSPQLPRAINCVLAYTYAMTAYAVRCALVPTLPNNEGMYRPVTVRAPEGCILNPRFPAPVVSRSVTGHYVPILVFGALHQVIPERVMAGVGSPLWAVAQSGVRAGGKTYTNVFFFNGGMGATAAKDGEHVLSWPSNISSTPVEVAERNGPMFFHAKRMRPGSGGAGRFRGGLGQDIVMESESETPVLVSFMAERTRFPAPGFAGGADGGRGDVQINGRSIDHRRQHVLQKGDVVLVRTPGGAGYGPAAERDPALTRRDRALGYVAARPRRAAPTPRAPAG
jgi:N-methylhydantoinase B